MAQQVKNSPVMQETQVWSLDWEDALEEEIATHSSILARKIPLTEEPGMLQSIGSQKVKHSWSEWAHYKCLSINEWATKCIPKEWNTIQP